MANQFQLAGAQAKPTKFAPLYVGRWSSGIWTNRSPLRDANTNRLTEKFYGPAGDALIDGLNVEITNRLTLARRPGNTLYDNNSWTGVDSFYDFHAFHGFPDGATPQEHIHTMVDQSNALYSLVGGVREAIWNKTAGAGQTYMQSVGNTLYFGNGVDNKKWLHEIYEWTANGNWTTANTPVLSTFIVDENSNIQQLTTQGISGSVEPTWSTTIPNSGNNFTGGTTTDGTAIWTNRGPQIENWGLTAPTSAPVPTIGAGSTSWFANTRYSKPGVVIDTNGNLQQVITRGTSGSSTPTWATSVGTHTTDGSVVWNMIQTAASLNWTAHHTYSIGDYIVAGGCLQQLTTEAPYISGSITAGIWNNNSSGAFDLPTPTSIGSAIATATGTSFQFLAPSRGNPIQWITTNGAGENLGTTTPFSLGNNYNLAIFGTLHVPIAGNYEFVFIHHDGAFWGCGGGATKLAGNGLVDNINPTRTLTAVNQYPIIGGYNTGGNPNESWTEYQILNFPSAGDYPIEIDYAYWSHNPAANVSLQVGFNNIVNGTPESGPTQPNWNAWTVSYAPGYPPTPELEAQQLVWNNLGPVGDFTWAASTGFTLPGSTIIDTNGNTQFPYRTGTTGTTPPTWATGLNQLTSDAPNLTWINQGQVTTPPAGSLSTFNGGWQYTLALVNTLDDTVSNCGPLSPATGNFTGATGITFAPGSGLNPSVIDPQADYVAIFRTTDGESTPFLIPGTNTTYTVKLSTYLTSGYTDTTPDTGLNSQIQGALAGQNTPPAVGAVNLTYHLNRIFFSVGNIVYWTSGPDTPVGNGVNGVSPLNFDELPSSVKRIVPLTIGALVFCVDGVYIIPGTGTTTDPIQPARPYIPNLGLLSYNALALNGSLIGMFTTENQFVILDPGAGTVDAGFPIGNIFRESNGEPGTNWNSANVYVTYHTQGEDSAFYVGDGQYGWFRLMPTPSPEVGYTWSPFAQIQGGCKAIASAEIQPGIHRLLVGPYTSGPILQRDLTAFVDVVGSGLTNTPYPAYATLGSSVLAQPGQLAAVMFITTDSVRLGTPLLLGVLMNEAVPYYSGPFDILKAWEDDPTNVPSENESILGQRFYMDELRESAAVCRHMQVQIIWSPSDDVQNELLSLTTYGGYTPEG